MLTLKALLNARSHRDLELMARAHKRPFSRRVSKASGRRQLSNDLYDGVYAKAIQCLTAPEIEALQALVAHGGALDARRFTAVYGRIRRYRSWHQSFGKSDDNPRHPWRYPCSTAERLFQLGMIHRNALKEIELVLEVALALPPLPELMIRGTGTLHHAPTSGRTHLLRDLSVFFGIITRVEARAIHGRWLSIDVLRKVNRALSIKEDMQGIRSELGTGRLRWLHYLAQVTGLLCVADGQFMLTPLAWEWLDAPPLYRWDMLWHAVEHDLLGVNRLWDQFRFPAIDQFSALVLRHLIADGVTDDRYYIKDILTMARPYLLESHPYDLALFMRNMLAWSGMVSYNRGRITVQSDDLLNSDDSTLLPLTWLNRRLPIQLSSNPHPHALTRLLSFAEIENIDNCTGMLHHAPTMVYITPSAMRTAWHQGLDCGAVVQILCDLTGESVPSDAICQLNEWFQQAQQLVMQPMMVLHSDNPDQITAIHDDWRLRPYIRKKLSPQYMAVEAEQAHLLVERLERRDYPVTSSLPHPAPSSINEGLNTPMVDYLLLAVRTYQKLYDRLDNSIVIPAALRHWLDKRASDPAKIEASVDVIVQQLQKAIPSQIALPDGLQTRATIERLVRLACHDQSRLTITYYSPHYDETSTRDVLIHEIYESRDWTYLDAHCFRDDAPRTFRLDRVLRVQVAETSYEHQVSVS